MEERVISLKKDRVITLSKSGKSDGEKLQYVFTGLRWGKIKQGGEIVGRKVEKKVITTYTGNLFQRLFKFGPREVREEEVVVKNGYRTPVTFKDVDLDSSVLVYDEKKKLIDKIYYGHLVSDDNAIRHYGDDVHGGGSEDVDNEIIRIEFDKISSKGKYLVVILNSYRHDKFDEIPFAQMKIYSSDMRDFNNDKINTLKTFAEYRINNNPEFIGKEALVLGVFYRTSGDMWDFKAVGVSTREKSIAEMASGSALDAVKSL